MRKHSKKLRLLAMALALAMLALLAGCTYQGDGSEWDDDEDADFSETEQQELIPPDEVVRTFFDAYTTLDAETTGSLLTGIGDPYAFGTLTGLLAQHITVEFGEPEQDGDICVIPVTIQNIDLRAVFGKLPDTIGSNEEASAWLAEAMAAADVPMTTFETQVYLVREDAGWRVELTTGLSDALLGGYFTMMQELTEEAGE